uniref:Uncharacterized protein n=1 Tax=Tanacetum cinerariifolium TaxID=118510 RepID=A0A6L2K7N7_TANCI|nr:hypothetical protein [Tanacetum cinerariifolium]
MMERASEDDLHGLDNTTHSANLNAKFKINDEFLKILQDNTFNGIDKSDVIDHMAKLELHRSILHDHTRRLDALPPTLIVDVDWDVRELYTRSGVVRDEILSQRYRFRSLKREQERLAVTFRALWRPVLALEAWAGHTDA